MEIKTTKEIGNVYSNYGRKNKNKEWIAVDDIRQFFKDNMFSISSEIIQKFEKSLSK